MVRRAVLDIHEVSISLRNFLLTALRACATATPMTMSAAMTTSA